MTYPLTFDTLYAQNEKRVLTLAAKFAGREHAEDLAQIVWLKVFRSWEGFRREALPSSWLHTIVRNAAYDLYRRNRRKTWGRGADVDAALVIEDRTQNPERGLLLQARRREARARLRKVPKDRRLALLARCSDLSYRDAADALNIPVATMKSRAHRGLTDLRRRAA